MKRGGPLRRKTRMRAVNPERKAKRYARSHMTNKSGRKFICIFFRPYP